MQRISSLLAALLSLAGFNAAYAHPGRTDANGGHTDRRTGTYHTHGAASTSIPPQVKTTARTTAPTFTRVTPRTEARTEPRPLASVPSAPSKPSAKEAYSTAKFAYANAIAGLERIKTEYPGTDEARLAQELLLSQCQIIQDGIGDQREKEAQAKMRLAKSFHNRGKTSEYIRWLKDIVNEYGDTPTGEEAAQELKKWE